MGSGNGKTRPPVRKIPSKILETRNSVRQHSHPSDGCGRLSARQRCSTKARSKGFETRDRVPPGCRKRKKDAVCSKNGQRRPNHSTTFTAVRSRKGWNDRDLSLTEPPGTSSRKQQHSFPPSPSTTMSAATWRQFFSCVPSEFACLVRGR